MQMDDSLNHTVLIVDDDSSIRWVLARALSNAQFKVISCDNGQQALDMIRSNHPQLVITDIQMSGMSGLELLNIINQNLKLHSRHNNKTVKTRHSSRASHYQTFGLESKK